MKRAACLLLALCALVVTVLIGLYGWYASPKQIVSRKAGFELPLGSKLVRLEQEWGWQDGYSLWVFQMPPGSRARLLGNCQRLGYDIDLYVKRGIMFYEPPEIKPDDCFKMIVNESEWTDLVVVTSDDRVFRYVSGS